MYERNLSPLLRAGSEDDECDIAFGSAEWHRRAAIVGAKLTERAAALPGAIRERPIAEIVAEDHGPGIGVRTYSEILLRMEMAGTLAAAEDAGADSDARELVA